LYGPTVVVESKDVRQTTLRSAGTARYCFIVI
jgi:hypothetical protein